MKSVIGIDVGSEKSAFVHWGKKTILDKGIHSNEEMLSVIEYLWTKDFKSNITLAVEIMVNIHQKAGKSICDTIFWSGRFYQIWNGYRVKVPAGDVRVALCGTMRSDDVAVRKVLIQRFGEPGSKKNPGLTYGLGASGYHLWRAFGVAVFWMDHMEFQGRELK